MWLGKTEPDKPWTTFPVTVHGNAQALFEAAITTEVGNGANTKFWTDRWLQGSSIKLLAPNLFATVPKRRVKKRIVQEALMDNQWVHDIQGHHSVEVLSEFLDIWDLVQETLLLPEVEDVHK